MSGEGGALEFCLSEVLSMTVEAWKHSESHLGISILKACTVKARWQERRSSYCEARACYVLSSENAGNSVQFLQAHNPF